MRRLVDLSAFSAILALGGVFGHLFGPMTAVGASPRPASAHAGTIESGFPDPPPNTLTGEERAEGWRLLFDGETTDGWRGFRKDALPDGWAVEDGCLTRVGAGGDIVTIDQFSDFEFVTDWKVEPGGNSGIMWRVDETHGDYPWQTGPEMQVLDNARHADGKSPLTSAGACYGLFASAADASKPAGEFNTARIRADGPHVTLWLNGKKLCEFEIGSEAWNEALAASKFASMPHFAKAAKGRIALQDHGDKVWFRNIKIRALD